MKIKESKNIKYDKSPRMGDDEGYEKFNPENCFLSSFNRVDDKLVLFFRNGSQAVIKAINIEGGREMDLIESKLSEFLGKPYEDILNAKF